MFLPTILAVAGAGYEYRQTEKAKKETDRQIQQAKEETQNIIEERNKKIKGMKTRLFNNKNEIFGEEVTDEQISGV